MKFGFDWPSVCFLREKKIIICNVVNDLTLNNVIKLL